MNSAEALRVLALAEASDPGRPGSDEARGAALRAVAEEIVPAIEHFSDDAPASALRLVGALADYWQDSGRVVEGRQLTEQVVERTMRASASDPAIAAAIPRALLVASELAFRQGDQDAATKRAHDCIRAAILVDDRVTASLAHSVLARVAYRAGDAPEIEKHARKALELAGDDALAKRGALHMLAWAAHTAGDLDEAERRFETSLEYRREHGSRISVAAEIGNLGDLAAERGDLGRAAALLAECMEVSRELGSAYMLVNNFPSFAVLATRAGHCEDAARLFGAGDAIASISGLVPDPNASVHDAREAARRELGTDRFEALLDAGQRLSTDDAVALALAVAARLAARLGAPLAGRKPRRKRESHP